MVYIKSDEAKRSCAADEVVIPPEHNDTFMDIRLPLVERLAKLALLMGANPQAESLVREAVLRLSGFIRKADAREHTFHQLTDWNNRLRADKMYAERRIRELEYEVNMLRGQVKD